MIISDFPPHLQDLVNIWQNPGFGRGSLNGSHWGCAAVAEGCPFQGDVCLPSQRDKIG